MHVVRWRRYGKDRLYVTSADGTKLGWRDLVVGADHPESPETAEILAAAVADWLAAQGEVTSTAVPSSVGSELSAPDTSLPRENVPAPRTAPTAYVPTLYQPSTYEPTTSEPTTYEPTPYQPSTYAPTPYQPTTYVPTPYQPTPYESRWEDLAARRAGAAAREQALALRQAVPVRTFVSRVLGVHTDERAWRIGADGEELVAAQLAKLVKRDPRWFVLHAIPVGERGADIDHLAVGPGGVFTLNAKHHPNAKIWVGGNTFLVNGSRQPYLRNSRFEAARASKLLTAVCTFPVAATGVVVPVNAGDLVIKTEPADVIVVNRMKLVRRLLAQPPRLDERSIAVISEAARRSSTWRRLNVPAG